VIKNNLVRMISEELGMTQLQAKQIIQKTLDSIVNMLVKEGRIELRNFGVFEVRWRKPRKVRNPHTGEKFTMPERCTVIFKPGLAMQHRVAEECRRHESPQ
jgi:nucleoid DNA-binding protein